MKNETEPVLNIPTSYGAGAHISLNQQDKFTNLKDTEVNFTITGIHEYSHPPSYWVVLSVTLNLDIQLTNTLWPGFHISIGQSKQ